MREPPEKAEGPAGHRTQDTAETTEAAESYTELPTLRKVIERLREEIERERRERWYEPRPCQTCGSEFRRDSRYIYCSPTCAKEARRRRSETHRTHRFDCPTCKTCNAPITIRSGATYCSNACRQQAYRDRKAYAQALADAAEFGLRFGAS